jgi:hypothetical protein
MVSVFIRSTLTPVVSAVNARSVTQCIECPTGTPRRLLYGPDLGTLMSRKLNALNPLEQAAALALHHRAVGIGVDPVTLEGPGVDFLRDIMPYLGLRQGRVKPGVCPTCDGLISITRASNPQPGDHRQYCSAECTP